MKIIQTPTPPSKYSWGDPTPFDQYDLREFDGRAIDKIVYWYARGGYEGSGHLLVYLKGAWHHKDLSHCSCYGPLDDLDFSKPISSLSAWLEQATPEFRAEVQPLIDAIQNDK